MNEKGIPTETVVTHLAPPSSFMEPLTSQEYQAQLDGSSLNKKYKDTVDPRSAFEILEEKMQVVRKEEEKVAQQKEEEKSESKPARKEKSTFDEVLASPVTKQIGRELVRGVFGMLF